MQITMNRAIYTLLAVILCFVFITSTAYADIDDSRSYNFRLTVNGSQTATVAVGDEIALEVMLERTDANKTGSYAMYSMQDEIVFDGDYFSLVQGSVEIAAGYEFNVRTLDDGIRQRIMLSRVVYDQAGVETPDSLLVAKFNLKALQSVVNIDIISKSYKVNSRTADTYPTEANDVTVTVTGPAQPLTA